MVHSLDKALISSFNVGIKTGILHWNAYSLEITYTIALRYKLTEHTKIMVKLNYGLDMIFLFYTSHTLGRKKKLILCACTSVSCVATQHCSQSVATEAHPIESKFKKAFTLFRECHTLYCKSTGEIDKLDIPPGKC